MALRFFNNSVSPTLSPRKKANNSYLSNTVKPFPLQADRDIRNANSNTSVKKNKLDTLHNEVTEITASFESLESRRLLSAKDIMSTPAITVMPHELVINVKNIMQEHNISHVVVVNSNKQPIGMLGNKEIFKIEAPKTSFVQSVFNPIALAISENTLVREIALNFMKYDTSIFAVINTEKRVVGIISRSDLLELLVSPHNLTKSI